MTATSDVSLALAQKRPACIACTKSKRKCSKQLPTCDRCRVKKVRCAYLVTPILLSPASQGYATSASSVDQPGTRALTRGDDSSVLEESVSSFHAPIAIEQSPEAASFEDHWFLKPSSWEIDHTTVEDDNHITYPETGLDFFFDEMKAWLDQWTKENHCVFIHSRLYGADLPSPLQYARATWLTYRGATTKTSRKIALNMATNWSKTLVQEQSIYDSMGAGTLDLLGHLSRTQALLIFQLIGLFDGDIRARSEAESLSLTLTRWSDTLMETAAAEVASPRPIDPEELLNDPQITQLRSDKTLASTWKAWVLSESIRRTWIAATLTEAAFLMMKQGFAICPGSIAFNARTGLWDAPSPRAWLANVLKPSTTEIPVSCRGLRRLLEGAMPLDVDEFARALLAYGNGRERLEDWLASEL